MARACRRRAFRAPSASAGGAVIATMTATEVRERDISLLVGERTRDSHMLSSRLADRGLRWPRCGRGFGDGTLVLREILARGPSSEEFGDVLPHVLGVVAHELEVVPST